MLYSESMNFFLRKLTELVPPPRPVIRRYFLHYILYILRYILPFVFFSFPYLKHFYIIAGYAFFRLVPPNRFTASFASIAFNSNYFLISSLMYKRAISKTLDNLLRRADLFHQVTSLKEKQLISDNDFLSAFSGFSSQHLSIEKINFTVDLFWQLGFFELVREIINKNKDRIEKSGIPQIFPIKNIRDVTPEYLVELKCLKEKRTFEFSLPPALNIKNSKKTYYKTTVPPIEHYYLHNATIAPGYTLFINGEYILYEPAADPRQNLVAGIWQYVTGSKHINSHVLIRFENTKTISHENGILLSGRCTQNYFHWLIEYLPRLLFLDGKGEYPFIVNDSLPKQILETLDVFLPKNTKYIFYNNKDLLFFHNLIIPSMPIFHPDNFDIPYWQGATVSMEHVNFVTKKVSEHLGETWENTKPKRKIFISRRNIQGRQILNQSELESYFSNLGFEMIYPENMSFIEQVTTFRSAKIIVSATGAALSNLIFCHSNTLVFAFIATHNQDYCLFSNLAQLKQLRYFHILGEAPKTSELYPHKANYVHSPYSIDIATFSRQFEKLIEKEGTL